jgi:chromosome segregation ATPase
LYVLVAHFMNLHELHVPHSAIGLARRSHEELMDQLESTNRDLQDTTQRARAAEAQHLAANRQVAALMERLQSTEQQEAALRDGVKHRRVGRLLAALVASPTPHKGLLELVGVVGRTINPHTKLSWQPQDAGAHPELLQMQSSYCFLPCL